MSSLMNYNRAYAMFQLHKHAELKLASLLWRDQ